MGVRLFSDRSGNNLNQERRNARARRRNIRRKQQLRTDFCNLLIKHRLVENKNQFQAIIKQNFEQPMANLKLLGLKSVLEPKQLIAILYHYLKHRGSFNQNNLETKVDVNEQKQKELANHLYDINKLPSENQILIKENDSHIKGHPINYAITNQMWLDEIKQVLSMQKLDQVFVDEYLRLMQRRREYWQGPGSAVAPSPYGRWEYDKSGKPLKFLGGNLWDTKIGKCTYYPDQNRHLKHAPISELFNFFNEISVFKFIDEAANKRSLNGFEKQTILEQQLFSLAKITKGLKLKVPQDAPKIKNELKTTKQLLKICKQLQIDFNNTWDDYLQLDDVYQQISIKSELDERINVWKQLIKQPVDEKIIAEILSLPLWKNGTASLSKKAMSNYIEWTLNSDQAIEQMTYFNDHCQLNYDQLKTESPYLPRNYFDLQFLPLHINRVFKYTIDVINAIIKKYHKSYNIKKIVVELARELNSESVKKAIEKTQRQKEKEFQILLKEIGWNDGKTIGSKMKTKLLLWKQQNGIDLYDGQKIDLGDLKNRPDEYEVDHIIPYSQCFDNSMINMVLTKAFHNQAKGNRSPYQWLNETKFQELKNRLETIIVDQNLTKMWNQKVKCYFLNQTGFDEQFLAAQLNDTRYFSKTLFNFLQKFFKYNLYWNQSNKNKVVVANLKGTITDYIRYQVLNPLDPNKRLIKNRNIYSHHAIDASILTWVVNDGKFMQLCNRLVKNRWFDQDGIINYPKSTWFDQNKDLIKTFKTQLDQWLDMNNNEKQIKFSRPLEIKNNFQFANETLYALKQIDTKHYKIKKVDLLKSKASDLEKYFNEKHKDGLFNHVETFKDQSIKNELLKIYETYRYTEYQGENTKVDNPFVKYYQSEQVQNYLKTLNLNSQWNEDKIPLMWATKNGKPFWIRHVKVKEKSSKDLNTILLNHKQSNQSFYESINSNKYRIYRNQKGDYVVVGLSILNQDVVNGKSIVNEDKLKPMLEHLKIKDRNNYYEFVKGSMLINQYGDLFYISGGSQAQNKLAIKALAMNNYYIDEYTKWNDLSKKGKKVNGKIQNEQWQTVANYIVQNFKRCKVGILGEIKIIEW